MCGEHHRYRKPALRTSNRTLCAARALCLLVLRSPPTARSWPRNVPVACVRYRESRLRSHRSDDGWSRTLHAVSSWSARRGHWPARPRAASGSWERRVRGRIRAGARSRSSPQRRAIATTASRGRSRYTRTANGDPGYRESQYIYRGVMLR